MQIVNLDNVKEAGAWEGLKPGGYVCKYVSVTDVADKQYLLMEYDIAEGDKAHYYEDLESAKGFWGGTVYRSYKPAALPMFKRMCSAVTKSNPGYIFDGGKQNADEKTLVNKLIGLVLSEEEYIGNDGNVKTRLKVAYECTVDDIRNGNYKVPALKKLDNTPAPTSNVPSGFVDIPEGSPEEVPFA